MDVILVGHSFVRRYRDAKLPRRRYHSDRDITAHQPARAASMAESMRLSRHIHGVYTISQNIIYFHHVFLLREPILSLNPRAVIVDIGSNDLARMSTINPRRILQLASDLHNFLLNLELHLVVVNAILPCTAALSCTPATFAANARYYNTYMSEFCDTSPRLVFNKQRGLQYTSTNQPRPVHTRSHDGIHLSTSGSAFACYESRIRHSLLDHIFH